MTGGQAANWLPTGFQVPAQCAAGRGSGDSGLMLCRRGLLIDG